MGFHLLRPLETTESFFKLRSQNRLGFGENILICQVFASRVQILMKSSELWHSQALTPTHNYGQCLIIFPDISAWILLL